MSTENNHGTGLVKGKGQMITENSGDLEVVNGKVLVLTEETANADVKGYLVQLMQYANIAQVVTHIEKGVEYIVQIPLEHKKAFQAGELLMNESKKTGINWPTLVKELENGKREIVANLPVKEELRVQGNPFESIAQGYQNIYLQQQITELTEIMTRTLKVVEQIEKGQKDDRVGLMKGAKSGILLALKLPHEERQMAIVQARAQLHEAQGQILETLRTKICAFRKIPESAWKRFWIEVAHSGTHEGWGKDFREIQSYYSLYLQATQLLADSYAICGHTLEVERVYELAEEELSSISFDAMKTLRYIQKERNGDMFYYHPVEYITADKEACLEAAKDYDYIALKVSGEKMLEAFNDGK